VDDSAKRLFVGIKISKALQNGLDSPARDGNNNFLQIINVGEHRFIGTYVEDGCPVGAIADAGRSVCRVLKLMTRGGRIEENAVEIYSS